MYGATIKAAIARVHLIHLMNVEQCQIVANSYTTSRAHHFGH